jgi:mediator of RNA polymerase II transcription subunit 23
MVCRLTIALYELLEKVDKTTPQDTPFIYMDVFCDLLYHIKYMFTGDIVKSEVEAKIKSLRSALQIRLRFVTHLNIEDITTTVQSGGQGQGMISQSQSAGPDWSVMSSTTSVTRK